MSQRQVPPQTIWGWKIAAYLFLAGAGAGTYVVGVTDFLAPAEAAAGAARVFMWLGLAAVATSVLFLVWDLGRPQYFLRALFKVRRSWLARGSWILVAFCVVALATLLLQASTGLAIASLALALAVASYTGLLLGTMLSRPLWNTPVLPLLFLVSALTTGIALAMVGGGVWAAAVPAGGVPLAGAAGWLRGPHIGLLATELVLLYFYLNVAYGRSRSAVLLLLRGPLMGWFWGGVVTIGMVLPIVLLSSAGGVGAQGAGLGLELVSDCAVLVGGFLLRRVILSAGIRSPVQLGVPFVIRPQV